MKKQFSLGS